MTRKGFSMVEILIVFAMTGIVLSAVYMTYSKLFTGAKQLSKISESNIENIMSGEIVRIDLSCAGIGLGAGELKKDGTTLYPVWWEDGALQIFSTYDRMEPKSYGWVLMRCSEASSLCAVSTPDERNPNHFSGIKAIDSLTNKVLDYSLTTGSTSDNKYAIGYPYDPSLDEKFRVLEYFISDDCDKDGYSDKSDRCAPGTSVLCRGKNPVVDCVGGFKVFAGYEYGNEIYYNALEKVIDENPNHLFKLRRLVIHLLVQEGQFDKQFRFGTAAMAKELDFELEDNISTHIEFDIPEKGQNFRWNILTIDSKTFNVGDKYD